MTEIKLEKRYGFGLDGEPPRDAVEAHIFRVEERKGAIEDGIRFEHDLYLEDRGWFELKEGYSTLMGFEFKGGLWISSITPPDHMGRYNRSPAYLRRGPKCEGEIVPLDASLIGAAKLIETRAGDFNGDGLICEF